MDDSGILSELGIGAVLVLLVLREVFSFLGRRNGNSSGKMTEKDMRSLQRQVADLHHWHEKEDGDGVKVWYMRPSLEKAIDRLTAAIEHQLEAYGELLKELRRDRHE